MSEIASDLAMKSTALGNPVPYDRIKDLVAQAGANPAELVFPTDKWGFTSDVKKAVLKAAGTVRGQDDKHALLVGTLAVLIKHIQERKVGDAELAAVSRQRQLEAAAARAAAGTRVAASVTNPDAE